MKLITRITKTIENTIASFPFLINIYSIYYKRIVEKEIKLGQIKKKDRVLCIGGGPLPCTALEIAKKTGANVHIIDNDPQAVHKANCVIKELGLAQQVCVQQCDGRDIDVDKFSVIHIALQAEPRDVIFKNIWHKASCGSRILIRYPLECLESFYSAFPENVTRDHILNKIEQNNSTMKATLLFVKNRERKKVEKKFINHARPVNNSCSSLVS